MMEKTTSRFNVCAFAIAIWFVAAALSFCALLCPVKAMAADEEPLAYSYGGTKYYRAYYYNIDDVLKAGYEGATIIMNRDWELSQTLTIADSKSITIDMNGHKISGEGSFSDGVIRLCEHSSLTLTSSTDTTFSYQNRRESSAGVESSITTGGLVAGIVTENAYGCVRMDKDSQISMDHVAIAGGYGKESGAFYVKSECKISMSNGAAITGCTDWAKVDTVGAFNGGGGISIYGSDVTVSMDNASIDNNCGGFGGGIYSNGSNTVIQMENGSKISDNMSMYDGGGVAFRESHFKIFSNDKTGVISGNYVGTSSGEELGGGIYVEHDNGSNEGEIKGLTIKNNRDKDGEFGVGKYNYVPIEAKFGGGIHVDQDNVTIEDCVIEDNAAKEKGGGLSVRGKNVTIKNCSISGNSCKGIGGGVYVDSAKVDFVNCSITGNSSKKEGGGIYDDDDGLFLTDCSITGNVTNKEGGGVYVYYKYDLNLAGKLYIKGNTRTDGAKDDLFLDDYLSTHAYLNGGVEKGTKIGIRTGTTGNRLLAQGLSSYIYGAFFMDMPNYYVSYENDTHGKMWQDSGNLKFMANLNGVATKRYYEGDSILVNVLKTYGNKVFWHWDQENSTGLYPFSEYVPDDYLYSPVLTYKMPQNDTDLKAVYADRVTKADVTIEQPVAGEELPTSASLERTDGGVGGTGEIAGRVTWYEVAADGTKSEVTGIAKADATYVAEIYFSHQKKGGLYFSAGMTADDVTVNAGQSAGKAASVTVTGSNGNLTVQTETYKTGNTLMNAVKSGSVTVNLVNGGLGARADESSKSMQATDGTLIRAVKIAYNASSESVVITAPEVDGFNFCNWDGVKSDWINDDVEGTVVVPADDLKDGQELTAVYTPVVTGLKVGLSTPVAGEKLASKATSLIAETSDGQTVDLMAGLNKKSFKVSWAPGAKTAACSSTYAAVIELAEDEGYEGLDRVLSEDAAVTLTGGEQIASAGFAVVGDKLCLCLVAPETGKVASVTGLKAAKAGKGTVKVSWKKGSRDGVQIRYSTVKSMKGAKKASAKGKAAKAKTIKKLKSGKRYYFQVRAYKIVDGKKCYSAWSAKKSVKVK